MIRSIMTENYDNFVKLFFGKEFAWKHNGSLSNEIKYVKLTIKNKEMIWDALKKGKLEHWPFEITGNDIYMGKHVFPYDEMMDETKREVECNLGKSKTPNGRKVSVPRSIIKPTK
jgi:hypothetical protein